MRSKNRTYHIAYTVPKAIDVIHLIVHYEYYEREWGSGEDYKALDDVGCDDIKLH
jgi:hypothetical protein